ncbi:MAG: hypothetical protein H8E44_12255, partial [Planctomycetes bacterium]|nr:hypothetical protein [Planctomycetota bacterium]
PIRYVAGSADESSEGGVTAAEGDVGLANAIGKAETPAGVVWDHQHADAERGVGVQARREHRGRLLISFALDALNHQGRQTQYGHDHCCTEHGNVHAAPASVSASNRVFASSAHG